MSFRIPTDSDQQDFIVHLYFGPGNDYLALCVRRAYLDFNRTLHGFSRFARADALRRSAHEFVRRSLADLTDAEASCSANRFDPWHRMACLGLVDHYRGEGFPGFTVGQAQKWLNMSLKYAFALGDRRVPGSSRWFSHAHIPLDSLILDALRGYGAPELGVTFSRLAGYAEYMAYQLWLRRRFPDVPPMAVEFHLFNAATAFRDPFP